MHRGCHHRRCSARPGARSDRGEPGLTRTVSLLVPGLAADFGGYAPAALPPAPALSTWIARADVAAFSASWCEQAIAALCGNDPGLPPPVATLTYREDFGTPAPAFCLRADPVHLRADTRGLILFDAASFALDEQESRSLADTLNTHLAGDGLHLVTAHPRRWYLLGDRPSHLETRPLPLLRGTPVAAGAYGGDQATEWIRRLNELQMLMHTHPVNQARAARGQAAVNSVWLWGAGELQTAGATFTCIAADNTFARGIARECAATSVALPEIASSLPLAAQRDDRVLVVLEDCRDASAYEETAAWQAAVERLERDWFAPLLAALKRRRVDVLELYALNGKRYRLTRTRLLALWKGAGDYRRQHGFRHPAANRV